MSNIELLNTSCTDQKSSGIFGGSLENPVAESTKQCCRAYKKFVSDYSDYDIDVKLCAFSKDEMVEAQKVFG